MFKPASAGGLGACNKQSEVKTMRAFSRCGAIALGAMFVVTGNAGADFLGLSVERHATVSTPQGTKAVWRVYAYFSDGADQVVSWGGMQALPAVIESRECSEQLGGDFFNPGGVTAPSQAIIDAFPAFEWDTFVTIGVSVADQGSGPGGTDMTQVAGMTGFITDNQYVSETATVFIAGTGPGTEQARADYAGDGDPLLRVLLMQLTTPEEDGVRVRRHCS